jgi:hypothetical protein
VNDDGNVLSMAEFGDDNIVSMEESGVVDGGEVVDDFAHRYQYDLDLFDINELLRWARR